MNNREWKKKGGGRETQASERKVEGVSSVYICVCTLRQSLESSLFDIKGTHATNTNSTRGLRELRRCMCKRRLHEAAKQGGGKRKKEKTFLLTRLSVRCTCLLACQSTAQPRPPTPDLLRRAPAARPLRLAGTAPRRERHCHLDLRPNLHTGPAADWESEVHTHKGNALAHGSVL